MAKIREKLMAVLAALKGIAARLGPAALSSRLQPKLPQSLVKFIDSSQVRPPILRGVFVGAITFGLVIGAVYPIGRQRAELSAKRTGSSGK